MTTLITSLNQKLLDEYGRKFIESFEKYSRGVKLIVVFEGDFLPEIQFKSTLVQFHKLESKNYIRFQETFGKLFEANGITLQKITMPNGQIQFQLKEDFRFNLIKFSFKIFSLNIARAYISSHERFAWIDADVRCINYFDDQSIDPFLPEGDEIMSYLGRTHFPEDFPYSECGFLGFNPLHPQAMSFLDRMTSLYCTGEAFRFEQWHDSWLWDVVRREYEALGYKFKNLSGNFADLEHPFVNSGLGQFFDHLKGPKRNLIGKSHDSDYKQKRR
jgi:hypothetical protein